MISIKKIILSVGIISSIILLAFVFVPALMLVNEFRKMDSLSRENWESRGWTQKALEHDEFESFFPLQFKENFFLISPGPREQYDFSMVNNMQSAFLEYKENTSIDLPAYEKYVLQALTIRQGFYGIKDPNHKEEGVFQIWLWEFSQNDFLAYQGFVMKELEKFNVYHYTQTGMYKGRAHVVYFVRQWPEDKDGIISPGGAWIFFPEKNVVEFIELFDTTYASPESYRITQKQVHSVVQQIIDSVDK